MSVALYFCIYIYHTQKLDNSSKALKKVQAFQGGVPEARGKESPLAGILFTVYVVSKLAQSKLYIYVELYLCVIYCMVNSEKLS